MKNILLWRKNHSPHPNVKRLVPNLNWYFIWKKTVFCRMIMTLIIISSQLNVSNSESSDRCLTNYCHLNLITQEINTSHWHKLLRGILECLCIYVHYCGKKLDEKTAFLCDKQAQPNLFVCPNRISNFKCCSIFVFSQ